MYLYDESSAYSKSTAKSSRKGDISNLPEPWRYSRYDVSVFIAVSRYSTDTAESCCIDIHPCVHVWVTVSDVSCCIASEAGVNLSVKVMVIMLS